MSETQFSGARWWKVDFHAHTPASFDFGSAVEDNVGEHDVTYQAWLLAFMEAQVDAVVIADHNSHDGIEKARTALAELREGGAPGFRELALFPGVEITTDGGFHLLAVFDVTTPADDVNKTLHRCGFEGQRGTSDQTTSKSFQHVVAEVVRSGGIPIPAHADMPAGIFSMEARSLQGVAGQGLVRGVEVVGVDVEKAVAHDWVPLLGSDSHHLDAATAPIGVDAKFPGSHSSWVKMREPNLDGLKLALSDGEDSIRRSLTHPEDPNTRTHSWIRSVVVEKGGARLELQLDPWLNAIIGGRGTGKSTIVELLRVAMARDDELPPRLATDLRWFSPKPGSDARVWDDGLNVEVEYRRPEEHFRLTWDAETRVPQIRRRVSEEWSVEEGSVRDRFPVLINSQKQIYELASDPLALLRLIDQQPAVDWSQWERERSALALQYRTQMAEAAEQRLLIADESRVRGNLADANSLVTALERQRDSREARRLDALRGIEAQREVAERSARALADATEAALSQWARTVDTLDASDMRSDAEKAFDTDVTNAAHRIEEQVAALRLAGSSLAAARAKSDDRHKELAQLLAALRVEQDEASSGSSMPLDDEQRYLSAVQRRDDLAQQVALVEAAVEKIAQLNARAAETLAQYRAHRTGLTARRKMVLAKLSGPDLQLKLHAQAEQSNLEVELRRLTRRTAAFDSAFSEYGLRTLLGSNPLDPKYVDTVQHLREALLGIHAEGRDALSRFGYKGTIIDNRLASQIAEIDETDFHVDVNLWTPEDHLSVRYKPDGSSNFTPINQGSPGQKTAAMLALVLQLGDQPLVLDQPEDDLDNLLIFGLVVKTLRRVKTNRQVIVVTHNANVVVNADAEHVVALSHGPLPTIAAQGGLQEKAVRESVCAVLEGGERAFESRFERLYLKRR